MILNEENSSIDQPVNSSLPADEPSPEPGEPGSLLAINAQPRAVPGALNNSEPLPGGEPSINNSLPAELQPRSAWGNTGLPGGEQPGAALSPALDSSEVKQSEPAGEQPEPELYAPAWEQPGDNSLSSDPSGGEPAGRLLCNDQYPGQPSGEEQAQIRADQNSGSY